jgi:quinol monooxygenase YgiN
VITALLRPLPGKGAELRQTLTALVDLVRLESGCLECVAAEELSEGPSFLLFMAWRDLPSLEAHLASDAFHVLLGAVQVLTSPKGVRILSAPAGHLPASGPIRPAI